MDPFARSSGHVVLKRKDDRDRGGWGGGGSSSGGGKGGKGGRVTLGSDGFGMSRGEPLGVGAYRDVDGRTCLVLEVGNIRDRVRAGNGSGNRSGSGSGISLFTVEPTHGQMQL